MGNVIISNGYVPFVVVAAILVVGVIVVLAMTRGLAQQEADEREARARRYEEYAAQDEQRALEWMGVHTPSYAHDAKQRAAQYRERAARVRAGIDV